jgi:Tfp pilus assembly protein PilF
MKYLIAIFIFFGNHSLMAQQDIKSLQETAAAFRKQGDYTNAELVLTKALQQDDGNLSVGRDLAWVQFLRKEYNKAAETIRPFADRRDADVQTFQVAAMIYKAKEDAGEADKIYKKALKKFPNSGPLYSEYGELLFLRQDYSAIKQWEKGIELDPNYPGNYYNAARYYYFTLDKTWSIIYGEIFVNMESYSRRTIEMKNILLNSYKKLFIDNEIMKNQNSSNPFTTAFLSTMNRQAALTSKGITPESLTMIRTRFILDWDEKNAARFPFRLFEYHRQLLKEGLFDAYNQWLFGSIQNLTAFQNWINTHNETYKEFTAFQQGRIFKMPGSQNYQSK